LPGGGITNIYNIGIPELDEIKEDSRHPEWRFEYFSATINWREEREFEVKKFLNKFTDLKYDDAKNKRMNQDGEKLCIENGEKRTIFMVGPCIVAWGDGYPEDRLGNMLYTELVSSGITDYKIIKIGFNHIMGFQETNLKSILEYDIHKNDIILFIDHFIDKDTADLYFDYIFNDYIGEKWLYSDIPVHTTRMGNKLIAGELVRKIIKPVSEVSDKKFDDVLLYKGEKQLTCHELENLEKHLKAIKVCDYKDGGIVGACVMACNPFTSGHRFLIEYASKQVDLLYVLVLEEEGFYFTFEERIDMVRKGTEDLKNVVVASSGKLLISKSTFKNYYEKEIHPDAKIDADKDVLIFKKYVVPELGITRRYVGEEPTDNITSQYNQLLKKELKDVIDVIEIPRKTIEGNEVISAKKVRGLLSEEKWNEIKRIVPESTFRYLKENLHKFEERKLYKSLNEIMDVVKTNEKIIMCGLGTDAEKIIRELENHLGKSCIEKICFYDKNAAQTWYRGKKVISFDELVREYKDYCMLITTSKYKREVFNQFYQSGIHPANIRYCW